jgi:hypothetical protein
VFSTGAMFLIRNKANGLLALNGPAVLLIDRVYFLYCSAQEDVGDIAGKCYLFLVYLQGHAENKTMSIADRRARPSRVEWEQPLMRINSGPAVRQPGVLPSLNSVLPLQNVRMVIGDVHEILGKNKLGEAY